MKGQVLLTLLVGGGLAWGLPLLFDSYTLTLLTIYGLLALSLGLIWGYGGILCFGQSAFYGLGAYTYAIAALNLGTPWEALGIAVLIPAVFAALLGLLLFYGRLSDVYLAVVTLVITLLLFKFMNAASGDFYTIGTVRLNGYNGIPGFPTLHVPGHPDQWLVDEGLFHVCLALLLLVLLLLQGLLKTPFGRVVVAIRENEIRTALMGYDTQLHKTGLFTLGGAIAGLAGALYANWAEIVTPALFGIGQAAEIIIWVIIGGTGTLSGPVLGAVCLGWLKIQLGKQAVVDNLFVMGMLLLVAVLWLPRGLLPTIQRAVRRLRGPQL